MQAQDKIRKRVCKACDRCRLKKSKCDGASPCSRCNADNAICIFGERKKSQDKIYPKGYVEMLEQQQGQLVAGLRDLYNRLRKGQSWPGLPLRKASDGHPLTHDILERLDLLNGTSENGSNYEGFKEDCNSMQRKLLERGAPLPWRQGSTSSKAEHGATSTPSSYSGTPTVERFLLTDQFARNNTPPTPLMNSFFPRPSQVTPPRKQGSPMVATTFTNTGAFDSRVLSRAWMNDSMVVENPKDLTKPQSGFESFNTDFDQVMRDDPIYITQTTQMLNWNSTADLDFNKCTQDLSGA